MRRTVSGAAAHHATRAVPVPRTTAGMGDNARHVCGEGAAQPHGRPRSRPWCSLAGVVLALLATVLQAPSGPGPSGPRVARLDRPRRRRRSSRTGPTQIQLTFDDTIAPSSPSCGSPATTQPVETGPPTVSGTVVTAAVTEKAGPGAYRVAWQVTSDDGHPLSGESAVHRDGRRRGLDAAGHADLQDAADAAHDVRPPGPPARASSSPASCCSAAWRCWSTSTAAGPTWPAPDQRRAGPPGPATDFMSAAPLV